MSEKPRLGFRPLGLSYSAQGTYKGEQFLDAEQITRNKLYIYTREKNTGFDRRFLMKRVGEGWMEDRRCAGAAGRLAANGIVRHHMAWEYETFGPDGQCKLFGVNIFDYDWQTTGKRVKVQKTRSITKTIPSRSGRWRSTGRSTALPPGSSPTVYGDSIWKRTDERSVVP